VYGDKNSTLYLSLSQMQVICQASHLPWKKHKEPLVKAIARIARKWHMDIAFASPPRLQGEQKFALSHYRHSSRRTEIKQNPQKRNEERSAPKVHSSRNDLGLLVIDEWLRMFSDGLEEHQEKDVAIGLSYVISKQCVFLRIQKLQRTFRSSYDRSTIEVSRESASIDEP